MKKIILVLLFILVNAGIRAQSHGSDFRYAVGLRGGDPAGLSFKYNMTGSSSVEILAGFWSNWATATFLYERRSPFFSIDGMRWYYGGGGHAGFSTGTYYRAGQEYTRGGAFSAGLDVIVGLEYKIPQVPFAVSLDLKPAIEVHSNGNWYSGTDPGIGIKFTF